MYTVITISTTFLLSFALGVWAIPNIIKVSLKKSLFDMPDSRKIHRVPIPRLGGMAFFPIILIKPCCILLD